MPPKPRALRQCQNQTCFSTSKDMQRCAGCGRAHYCSTECQKQDWQYHKKQCRENAETIARMKASSKAGGVANGGMPQQEPLNVSKLDHDLKRWVQTQRGSLTWAAVQALELRTKPANQFTHCLTLGLKQNSSPNPSHRFNADMIEVVTFEDARAAMPIHLRNGFDTAAQRAREMSSAQKDKLVPLVIIYSGPMMRVTPVWLEGPLGDDLMEDRDWKTTFRRVVLGLL